MKDLFIKIILAVCFLTVCSHTDAQIGITGGINISTLRNGNTILRWDNSPGMGSQIGAFYDIDLSHWIKFQPSLMLLHETYHRLMPGEDYNEDYNSFSFLIPLVLSINSTLTDYL